MLVTSSVRQLEDVTFTIYAETAEDANYFYSASVRYSPEWINLRASVLKILRKIYHNYDIAKIEWYADGDGSWDPKRPESGGYFLCVTVTMFRHD